MIQTVKQVNAFNIFVLGVVVVPAVDVVDACVRFGLYGVVKDEIACGIGVAFSCCLSMGLISVVDWQVLWRWFAQNLR
ncbi:hypothetical protein [Moraxella osloensis]|uniref:hypothetical protein n=1 Tax=Faucicola osloensis TaxID=34062 RepID=UPI002003A7F1|nr:hypothetical protein [Moraxella osloensis]